MVDAMEAILYVGEDSFGSTIYGMRGDLQVNDLCGLCQNGDGDGVVVFIAILFEIESSCAGRQPQTFAHE